MIKHIDITGIHLEVSDELQKYIQRKLGRMDRYVPKTGRSNVRLAVKLKEEAIKKRDTRICEVILQIPGETITAKESTVNMYAAVDIVEAKLRQALKKYKDLHTSPRFRHRLLTRLKHRPASTD